MMIKQGTKHAAWLSLAVVVVLSSLGLAAAVARLASVAVLFII